MQRIAAYLLSACSHLHYVVLACNPDRKKKDKQTGMDTYVHQPTTFLFTYPLWKEERREDFKIFCCPDIFKFVNGRGYPASQPDLLKWKVPPQLGTSFSSLLLQWHFPIESEWGSESSSTSCLLPSTYLYLSRWKEATDGLVVRMAVKIRTTRHSPLDTRWRLTLKRRK